MKILVCGDFHGDTGHALLMEKVAKRYDCSAILQCGDYGYWPRHEWGRKFMEKVPYRSTLPTFWIDGNHEDFHALYDLIGSGDIEPTPSGFYEVRRNQFYIPRGTCWTWGKTTFIGCGGGYSIDRYHRTLGDTYFNEELITQRDFLKVVSENSKCDVLVTHDAPLHAPLQDDYKADPTTEANRFAVYKMMQYLDPKYLFHGHYHSYYTYQFGDRTTVVGLDRNERFQSYVVYDCEEKVVK